MASLYQSLYDNSPAFRRRVDADANALALQTARLTLAGDAHSPRYTYLQVGGLPLPDYALRQANALVKAERQGVPAVNTTRHGNVKVVHHIQTKGTLDDFKAALRRLLAKEPRAVKVNLTFTFITAKTVPEDDNRLSIKMVYATTPLFPAPRVVNSDATLTDLLGSITEADVLDRCWKAQRPNTQTNVVGIEGVNVSLFVLDQPMRRGGATIHPVLAKSRSIFTWPDAPTNLCFFLCLAKALAPKDDTRARTHEWVPDSKRLYEAFRGAPYTPSTARALDTSELPAIARQFGAHFTLWSFDGVDEQERIKMTVFRRPTDASAAHHLLLDGDHAMYITDLDRLTGVYYCSKFCGQAFDTLQHLQRHETICVEDKPETIPPASALHGETKMNALVRLALKFSVPLNYATRGIQAPHDVSEATFLEHHPYAATDEFYPWFVVFDIESMLVATNADGTLASTRYTHEHHGHCVSVSAHPDLATEPKCFMSVDYPDGAVGMWHAAFAYVKTLHSAATALATAKWGAWLDALTAEVQRRYAYLLKQEDGQTKHAEKVKAVLQPAHDYLYRLPLLGYNSARYDIPAATKDGFLTGLLAYERSTGAEGNPIVSVLGQGTYGFKRLETTHYVCLDFMNYVAAGTSLAKLYDDWLGKGRHAKQVFPYKPFNSVAFFTDTVPFTREDYYNDLKLEALSDEDWERAQRQWEAVAHLPCPRRAFLENYCNADTKPFVEVIVKMMANFWSADHIVMLRDGVGVPSIAETIMTRSALARGLCEPWDVLRPDPSAPPLDDDTARRRASHYASQDAKNSKRWPLPPDVKATPKADDTEGTDDATESDDDSDTAESDNEPEPAPAPTRTPAPQRAQEALESIYEAYRDQGGRCFYCHGVCGDTWTLDRLNNYRGHIHGNCVLACVDCNRARGNRDAWLFWRAQTLRRNAREHPQVLVLGRDGEKVVKEEAQGEEKAKEVPLVVQNAKDASTMGIGAPDDPHPLHRLRTRFVLELRHQITGGFSGVLHRKAVVGEPRPPLLHYDHDAHRWEQGTEAGDPIRLVCACDVVNLYPSTFVNFDSPCGDGEVVLGTTPTLLEDVRSGTFFGFVKCDVRVPAERYDDFAMWPPCFINREVRWAELSPYNQERLRWLNDGKDQPTYKERKLLNTLSATQVWFATPLLQWYLEHGLLVENITAHARFARGRPFKAFVDDHASRRQQAQRDGADAEADRLKTTTNSSYGRLIMNPRKFAKATPEPSLDEAEVHKKINDRNFRDLSVFTAADDNVFCVHTAPKRIVENTPVHMGNWVLQMAKLVLLRFVYDFLLRFVPLERVVICATDTDSLYLALAHPEALEREQAGALRSYVRADLLDAYDAAAPSFLVPDTYDATKGVWKTGKKVPGLMVLEWRGTEIVALNSKVYSTLGWLDGTADLGKDERKTLSDKLRAKGVQGRNTQADAGDKQVVHQVFRDVLASARPHVVENAGFRVRPDDRRMMTYTQPKTGMSAFYPKAWVFDDGVSVAPYLH